MSFLERLKSRFLRPTHAPQAAVQGSGGGNIIVSAEDLERALLAGYGSISGERVTPDTAMRVAAVYACVSLISGSAAVTPLDVKRRIDDKTRETASDTRLSTVLRRRPNPWQTPSQFKRMLTAHVLLRGNGYAFKVMDMKGEVQQLLPLAPDRTKPKQRPDLTIEYEHTRADGSRITFQQEQILHLKNMTLDGITGVTPITFARESIGSSLAMERHGGNTFRNGAQVSGLLTTEKALGEKGRANVRAGLEEYRAEGDKAGKTMILEEGLDYKQMALSGKDAQWIEGRKFTRSDIAMFFGVPPHMIGDTDNSSNWGTGLEQQTLKYRTYTVEEYFIMWEEGLDLSCIPEKEPNLYTRFNRSALVRSDMKTRQSFYTTMLQFGVYSPNEIRALEDVNPRDGGDIYYDPPNTAGTPSGKERDEE